MGGAALSCLTGAQLPALGDRGKFSAWVGEGCHSWLALDFLWAEPGARGGEGEHCDRVHTGPLHSSGTLTACWVVHTHTLSCQFPTSIFPPGLGRQSDSPQFPQVWNGIRDGLTYCLVRSPLQLLTGSKSGPDAWGRTRSRAPGRLG